jgi:hypothetical protein
MATTPPENHVDSNFNPPYNSASRIQYRLLRVTACNAAKLAVEGGRDFGFTSFRAAI